MEGLADIFSKEYSLKPSIWRWCAAIACYVFANVAWLYSIKNGSGLVRGANIFAVAQGILATVIGYSIYKEAISKTQGLGLALGIVSLILITKE